ncbi:enoyl-CoA hydratase/isomerase family protein [Rhodococcus sp. NPDC057529]|uniref:enoyl-CoA hydratase/isomerase family protein n=1 Tax=Rhodococcus sp. NPDC057529 TaxID=3346158 RepID=UPI003671BD7D
MSDEVLVDRDGAVAVVSLNRPAVKNAISFRMWDELLDIFSGFAHDDGVRAIVLRGTGRNFSAGTDIGDLSAGSGEAPDVRARQSMQRMRVVTDVVEMMDALPQPIVCAVHGVAIGGGMGLALGGDLVVAAPDAWFRVGTVSLGSMPDAGVPMQLYRTVGLRRAKQICMLDEPLTADDAERIGLVNRVLDADDVDTYALTVARTLAAAPGGQQVRIKRMLNALPDRGLSGHLRQEILDVGDCVRDAAYVAVVDGFVTR